MLNNQIATFEKVSFDQYVKDKMALGLPFHEEVCEEYKKIRIPSRATSGSGGYDFYLPFSIHLTPGEAIIIPTGIRCKIEEGYTLDLYPKSGLGFKFYTTIANTVGIIDADYYYSDNEGHILIKFIYKGFDIVPMPTEPLIRNQGESFVQGKFHECFAATNDNDNTTMKVRNGGFDSTK